MTAIVLADTLDAACAPKLTPASRSQACRKTPQSIFIPHPTTRQSRANRLLPPPRCGYALTLRSTRGFHR